MEFAGYFDVPPDQLRRALDDRGLRAPSMHVQVPTTGDPWRRALDAARVVGHEWIVVPWTDERDRATLDDWRRVADRLNAAAADVHAAGLRFAYHNHDFEFTPVEGQVPFDLLLARTDPALVSFELDVYWAVKAGRDPLDYLTNERSRVTMLHLKDATAAPARAMVDVGAGTIDWRAILAAARRAGVRHAFVEHDEPPDAFASIAASARYLSALRY